MRLSAVTVLALLAPASVWAQGAAVDPGEETEIDDAAEPASTTRVACLEDADAEGFRRKGVQKKDFTKRLRFELAGVGGLYASDVLSSTYTFGGALSFFPSEDFGLELMLTRTPVQFRLEQPYRAFDQEQHFVAGMATQIAAALTFSPFHAKFKVTEATIVHGDLFLVAGAGRTYHDSVQGITWQAGFGMRLYLWRHLGLRFDVRDFVLPQEVLGRGHITHNLTVLGGIGLWVW